jgi:hypothetical protein
MPPRTGVKKSGKRPDKRPARDRYWATRRLETRKVNNLMRCCGMSKQSAYNFWHKTRQGRVRDALLIRTKIAV